MGIQISFITNSLHSVPMIDINAYKLPIDMGIQVKGHIWHRTKKTSWVNQSKRGGLDGFFQGLAGLVQVICLEQSLREIQSYDMEQIIFKII